MNFIPTIYCQLSFIEKFLDISNDSILELLIDDTKKVDCISSCYKLMYGSANIRIDVSEEDLISHPNPMIKKLLKKESNNVFCQPNLKNEIESDEFWSKKTFELFMLDINREDADNIEKNWGVFVLTPEKLVDKNKFLVPSSPIFLKKDSDKFKWDNISFAKHYFHSIVIIDNFINNNSKTNLVPLLVSICKGNLRKRKIHITIATTNPIDYIHKNICNELNIYHLEVEIRIIKINKKYNHDRHIITNSLWIHSGFGFNLLDKDIIKQNTTLLIMPLFSNEIVEKENIKYTKNINNTYFDSVMSILNGISKIDFNTSDKIGTENTAEGEKNELIYNYFDLKKS